MRRGILGLFVALMLAGCGEDSVQQAIEASGFTNVQTSSSVVWWACDSKDSVWYNTGFTATAANGKRVEGAACGAMFKGWTIRITKVY